MTGESLIRAGIVGANPERGWARDAHVPALRHLSTDYTLAAVSARTQEIADAAKLASGAERAYGDSLALARDPGIDLVIVAVKVPEHRAVVLAALAAGKHVYCEWPLGRDVAQAEEMAAAVTPGIHATIGLQARSAPAVRQAAAIVQSGALGKLRSLRVLSPTAGWGAESPAFYAYLQDKRNGATLETIAGGHTLAAIEAVVGRYVAVDARATILRPDMRISGTEETVARTCADHMAVLGRHDSGCVSVLEVVGGTTTMPFRFELEGEHGWLRLTGGHPGGFQAGALTIESDVEIPPAPAVAADLSGPPRNVAESYVRFAADIRADTFTVPDFADAVRLSRLLDHIETASDTGMRQTV
ncbi:Gfo/Idh/MocA family oxidoreductase [uncultured Sphingomonas sp.]|uniref:Gfo/Idh/MocA family protein n=1 Tax=uncultured Sphingomonas sp. TaxID=158754 RepID=UPI0026315404|nr:Gfo/Idh/MocA family oxidoreductase [uncultured Sphingomonas sp.]